MRNKIEYEWVIETIDIESGDIMECDYFESLSQINWKNYSPMKSFMNDTTYQLALCKNIYHDIRGLQDRQYAYMNEDELPESFEDGTAIPKRFKTELENHIDNN
jgi:hypothetical protein